MTDLDLQTAPSPALASRRLVLASASPRRQQLMTEAGYDFVVDPANVDEGDFPADISPIDLAVLLAKRKARAVAARYRDDVVLGADTLVSFGERVIGKPRSPADARAMLKLLSGTTQIVVSAIAVVIDAEGYERTSRGLSAVRMRSLSEIELEHYMLSGLWRDKAGGYGVQDPNPIVRCVSGCESNVIGLPMDRVVEALAQVGIRPRESSGESAREGSAKIQ